MPWVVPFGHPWLSVRVWRLELREQTPNVAKQRVLLNATWSPAPRLEELREQDCHRHSLVHEEADVALWFRKSKGSFERSKCLTRFASCLQGKRPQEEDLDDATHPPSVLRCLKQPIEQTYGIVEMRAHRFSTSSGDEYARQGEILLLARIVGLVRSVEIAGFGPADGRW